MTTCLASRSSGSEAGAPARISRFGTFVPPGGEHSYTLLASTSRRLLWISFLVMSSDVRACRNDRHGPEGLVLW
jgi:hypothetical protein